MGSIARHRKLSACVAQFCAAQSRLSLLASRIYSCDEYLQPLLECVTAHPAETQGSSSSCSSGDHVVSNFS